jgi:23S rRNA (cytidine1920-2'-O)/16S rRNA (cytidine1409-2'-O)-methyltransferase
VDVSFISLRLVLPAIARLLRPGADAIVLVKPQFEAGKGQVGKKGVVRDPETWREVLRTVLRAAIAQGWSALALARSPISGPAGNVEFLAHLRSRSGVGQAEGVETASTDLDIRIDRVVSPAV